MLGWPRGIINSCIVRQRIVFRYHTHESKYRSAGGRYPYWYKPYRKWWFLKDRGKRLLRIVGWSRLSRIRSSVWGWFACPRIPSRTGSIRGGRGRRRHGSRKRLRDRRTRTNHSCSDRKRGQNNRFEDNSAVPRGTYTCRLHTKTRAGIGRNTIRIVRNWT
jgi:hypothetical protein